ncbi:hypothetical protein PR202_gb23038 [Eleusine coracana subsp. coracana]|uniref:BZIP domain-containing protein n=1 Tax=Eleusine coracana subsp. coracana TaxID=191504 RepID=A0AAV5FHC6_ELECO|nr:hypothetical protein QOZ80_6BG0483470 [Eleusine coracana subsp. coracana]GJN34382.1 hypothetical protein PR202_gb23038 [Eleusine coracana subsp. coracana]
MDEDRGNPARRRLPSPPGGHQGQGQLPRAPTDLFSQFQRRFSQSLLLPPMVPRLPSAASGSGSSAFSYYQGTPALAPPAVGAGGGSHLTRCLSHPPFFPTDQLAPLPYALPSVAGRRRPGWPVSPSVDAAALESVFGSYRVMGTLGSVVSGATEERHDHARGWSPAESSENEAENWAAAAGPRNPRHCRSLSVDSFMAAGNLSFGGMGQESPKMALPLPAAGASIGLSRAGSGPSDGPSAFFATTDLANGEFNEDDRKKIMSNDRLAEMAMTDPKRVKRILANRVSAAKSKERKVRYMGELERRVRVLQMETSALSAKMEREQRESDALKTQNNEMRIRVQALEQQAQLKNALNEAMSAEVQRLKQAIGEASDPRGPNSSHQHMGCQMTTQQLLQLQKQPSEAQLELAPQQQPQE